MTKPKAFAEAGDTGRQKQNLTGQNKENQGVYKLREVTISCRAEVAIRDRHPVTQKAKQQLER